MSKIPSKQGYMHITVSKGRISQSGAEVLVVPVFGDKHLARLSIFSPEALRRAERLAKVQEFTGKFGQVLTLPAPEGHGADVLLCIGVGEKRLPDFFDAMREMGGLAVQSARNVGLRTLAVDMSAKEITGSAVEAFAVGAFLANYAFDVYKKQNGTKRVAEIDLLLTDSRMTLAFRKVLERVQTIMAGVDIARNLVNVPAHDMTPDRLAEAAQEIAKASGGTVKVKVLHRAECAKLGMGAYLAVAQGADHEPKFITLTYTPARATKKNIALIGKGVTFDSGGLSLKPADGMMTMKCDMAGAAAVIGTFAILAKLRPRVGVKGYIAATENMPSGKAIRPGDVVRSLSGKTIEILNTDAEGRLTLADAITYALRDKPDVVVDLATLTGACMIALGEEVAGLMGNNPVLIKALQKSAKDAGENVWELPLELRYQKQVQSEIADLRNVATSRYGGSITAGLFLRAFMDEQTPWAHLDIAGPAFAERPFGACMQKGATGFGVRTLWKWIEEMGK